MDVAIIVLGSVASTIGGVIVTYLIIVSSQLAKQDEKWERQDALWKKNEEDHQALVRLIADVKSDLKADISRLENRTIRLEDKIDNLKN